MTKENKHKIDPTAKADMVAEEMREYYEKNRETWWERKTKKHGTADNLMLGLLDIVRQNYKEEE